VFEHSVTWGREVGGLFLGEPLPFNASAAALRLDSIDATRLTILSDSSRRAIARSIAACVRRGGCENNPLHSTGVSIVVIQRGCERGGGSREMSNAERIGATDVSDLFCDGLALLSRGCCIACIILSSTASPSPRLFPLWSSPHLFGKNGFSERPSHASSEDLPFQNRSLLFALPPRPKCCSLLSIHRCNDQRSILQTDNKHIVTKNKHTVKHEHIVKHIVTVERS
jgi:hypothetical protein